jgi:hypothetical protein
LLLTAAKPASKLPTTSAKSPYRRVKRLTGLDRIVIAVRCGRRIHHEHHLLPLELDPLSFDPLGLETLRKLKKLLLGHCVLSSTLLRRGKPKPRIICS